MKLANTLLLTILASTASVRAEATTSVEPYDLKNRSTFLSAQESRAPFWPIGWRRPKPGEPEQRIESPKVEAPKFQLSPDAFNVTSVLLGKPSFAVINGRSFATGDILPVIAGDERLKVQLVGVREEGVHLRLDRQQPVFVPMRRNILQKRETPAMNREEWAIKITKQ